MVEGFPSKSTGRLLVNVGQDSLELANRQGTTRITIYDKSNRLHSGIAVEQPMALILHGPSSQLMSK